MQSCDQFKHHLASASVKIAGRLIGQQDLRLGDERPCQRQALLLASGKLARTMMPALFQPDLAQPPRSLLFCGRQRLPARQQRHSNILQGGEFRQQIMELPDVADFAVTKLGGVILRERIHEGVCAIYRTRRRTIQRPEDVQQGTLSRTRLPHDREHRSLGDLEREILKEHEICFA